METKLKVGEGMIKEFVKVLLLMLWDKKVTILALASIHVLQVVYFIRGEYILGSIVSLVLFLAGTLWILIAYLFQALSDSLIKELE
jgi:hypothetical protein